LEREYVYHARVVFSLRKMQNRGDGVTLEYIVNPRYWKECEAYLAENKNTKSSKLYFAVEKISATLYVGKTKE
jgi:hypothetical protein